MTTRPLFPLRPVSDCHWWCKHTTCQLRSFSCMKPRQQNSSYGNQTPISACGLCRTATEDVSTQGAGWGHSFVWTPGNKTVPMAHTRWQLRSHLRMNPRPHNSSNDDLIYFRPRPVPDWDCRRQLRSLLLYEPPAKQQFLWQLDPYFHPRPVQDCYWGCKHTRWRFRSLLCMNPRPHTPHL